MNKLKLNNIFNKFNTVYLFCRDEKGLPIIKKDEMFKPYYYEPDETGMFRGYDGTRLKKIIANKSSEIRNNCSKLSFESDINICKRYLIDNIEIVKAPIRWMMLDIEVKTEIFPDVIKADKPISCVSVYDNFDNAGMTFWLPNYKSEFQMAERLAKYIKEKQPDLLIAFNGINFDFPYMFNRWPAFAKIISPIDEIDYYNKYPAGIGCVDYYQWDKKMTLNRRKQYTLDYIAEEEVGMKSLPKVDFNSLEIAVRDKNIYDLKRMIAIEKKKQYIPLFNDIRILSKCLWHDLDWNSHLIDQLLLQEAKNKGIALPKKPEHEESIESEEPSFEGAYRESFKTGLLKNISVYDLGGAYLNMIKDLCLDSANISNKEGLSINITDRVTNEVKNTYKVIQNENALLPCLVKKLINDKIKYKTEKDSKTPGTPEAKDAESKYNAMKSVYLSCFDGTTNLLTVQGIKNIKNIAIGDLVYSVNPKNFSVELDTVIATQEYHYRGKLLEYKTEKTKLRITPDHKFLVQKYGRFATDYKSAQECYESLNRHQYMIPKIKAQENKYVEYITLLSTLQQLNGTICIHPKNGLVYKYRNIIPKGFKRLNNTIKINKKSKYSFRCINAINITEKELLHLYKNGWEVFGQVWRHKKWSPVIFKTEDFAEFLGWAVSEGSVYKTKISIFQNKTVHSEYHRDIFNLLTRMLIGHIYATNKELSIVSDIIAEYLKLTIGKNVYEKHIPTWIFGSNIRIKQAFFTSLYKGDGNKTQCRYSTVSYQLVQDILNLLVSMGNNSVRFYKEIKINSFGKEIYRITWHNVKKGISKEYLHPENYNDTVYCCTTEKNHNLFAGSDGFFTLVGQCWGVLGNRGFRLFDPRIAGLITSNVRDLIQYVRNELYKLGQEIIYIDTDSCMVSDNGKNNSNLLNSLIQKWAKERFNKDSSIQFEYQGTFEKLFILSLCHYSGLLKTDNGIKLEEKGIEARKKDSTIFMAETQRKFIDMILNENSKEELIAYKDKRIEEMKMASLFDIALPAKIAPNKEYTNEPIHCRAFRYAQEEKTLQNILPGTIFYWIYVEPFGIETKKVDRKKKVTKKELKEGIKSEWTKNKNGDYFKIVEANADTEKNIIAFTEEEPLDIVKYKVNYQKMTERNITMKLENIFEAMSWNKTKEQTIQSQQTFTEDDFLKEEKVLCDLKMCKQNKDGLCQTTKPEECPKNNDQSVYEDEELLKNKEIESYYEE